MRLDWRALDNPEPDMMLSLTPDCLVIACPLLFAWVGTVAFVAVSWRMPAAACSGAKPRGNGWSGVTAAWTPGQEC